MNLFYGNSIKIYRRKHRLNQEELAQQLRISKSMLGMLENNNRNASEDVEKRIKDIVGISTNKELQEQLLNQFEKYLIQTFNEYCSVQGESSLNVILNDSLKELIEIPKFYYGKLITEKDFTELNELLSKYEMMSYIYEISYNYYDNNKELKKFYNTYTAFILDNIENIIEIINNYLSKDKQPNSIIVSSGKLPLNIRKDFKKIIKSINSTTYADYSTYTLNTYSFEKQLGFIINDDSMKPKYEIGNIVIINVLISNDIKYLENNKDYLIRVKKDFLVRRIQIEDEQVIFKPLNYNYDVKSINKDSIEKEEIEIIGKITDIKIN